MPGLEMSPAPATKRAFWKVPRLVAELLELGLDALAPRRCAACDQLLKRRAVLCATCAHGVVRARSSVHARSYAEHGGPLAQAVHRLKYRGRAELGSVLGALVAELVLPGACDVVVPVPTPAERLVVRGYNPAALLAGPVARRAAAPLSALALVRPSNAIAQATLPRSARLAIPRGTFVVSRSAEVAQRRVLLVDDVVTTGATLRACADALLRAGALEVRAVTLTASTATRPEGGNAR